ncbi:MAG: hypothetical protein JO040_04460 [Gemmatimonadetes bacterium]|nr:hypothetical protein [Gemmatimonadota bacterium]
MIDPDERVPYAYVVKELSDVGLDEAGLVLWQVLRDVRSWIEAISAPDEPTLRDEGWKLEGIVPELAATLPPLDRLLREPEPDVHTAEAVGLACMHVGLWAEEAAAGRTALSFFQAAEDADPDNPHYAYNIGRMARKLAMYDAAEGWLKWAGWVARGAGRWEVVALCTSGLGNLHRQRGNLPLAMRLHELTRRVAKRHDLRTLEGDALYDLAGISFDFGEMKRGSEYTRHALLAYGPGHTRVYTLARDVAWHWMDRYGHFEDAAHVLNALLEYIWKPSDRLLLLANLARAAAGAGWNEVFEAMWIESWSMMRQQPLRDGHAAALIQLAYGAGNMEAWDRAQIAAVEAVAVARERKEGEMMIVAESILNAVTKGVIVDEVVRSTFKDRQHQQPAGNSGDSVELASQLTNAMRVRRDDAPKGPAHTPAYR